MEKTTTLLSHNHLKNKILTTKSGKIKIRKLDKARLSIRIVLFVFIAITILTFATMNFGRMTLAEALPQFFTNIRSIFLQPRVSGRVEWINLIEDVFVTVGLTIIATILGSIISFFFALLAARNLSSKFVSQTVRAMMSFIRAIPAVLWVLVFSLAIGLGSTAAVIGLVFQGIAFLTKAYSEAIEEIDIGVIEALKAAGANWWQIIFQAVFPSCLTAILSWTFIRLEGNFAHAVAVGAAAGAGGIGFQLMLSGNMHFDMHEVGVIIYLLIAVSMIFEFVSIKLRSHLLVKH